jgi:hypothetical protein
VERFRDCQLAKSEPRDSVAIKVSIEMKQLTFKELEMVCGGAKKAPVPQPPKATGSNAEQIGGVSAADVINFGAATTAVGAAVLGGVAVVAGAPALAAGAAAYGVVSAGLWLYGAAKVFNQ